MKLQREHETYEKRSLSKSNSDDQMPPEVRISPVMHAELEHLGQEYFCFSMIVPNVQVQGRTAVLGHIFEVPNELI